MTENDQNLNSDMIVDGKDFINEFSVFEELVKSELFKEAQKQWIKSELKTINVDSKDEQTHLIHSLFERFSGYCENLIQTRMSESLGYQFISDEFFTSINKYGSDKVGELMNLISIILDFQSFKEFILNFKKSLDENMDVDLDNQEQTDVDNELFGELFDEIMFDDAKDFF